MIRPPSSALALLLTAASAFGADVNWDGGRVKGAASDPVVVAGARGSQPALGAPVNEKSLRRANEEVLRLREDVWAGQVAPEAFYAAVQEIYVRRFGAGYGPKVKAFLDAEAARAPRPAQAVDFAGMPVAAREAFFSAMPKGAELHLHLTGAIPADTMMKIGEELGTDLPIANVKKILGAQDLAAYGVDAAKTSLKIAQMSTALRKALAEALVSRDGEDFMAFLTKWQIIGPITSDPRAYDPMMGSMADYAKRQGILYLELMVAGNETSLTAAAESARRVQAESGVTIRLIGYSSWGMKNETVDAGLAKAGEIREVVGYNMVANEKNSPLAHYESFKKMRESLARLEVTLHAGEQSGTASNLVNDLLLGAKRYGHATHVEEDPLAAATLYANKTPVEVSLISNQSTHVMDDLSRHPLPKLLAWKVPVTLSTDDPGVFKSELSQEYDRAQRQFGLTWSELREISRNGIRHSFADKKTKERLLDDLNRRLKDFEKSPAFKEYRAKK